MRKIFAVIVVLLGLTFADTLQKDYAYVISAIGIKNVEGNVVWQSGSSNQLADGTYKLAPQVIVYDGVTQYVGAATPFTGCLNGRYYNSAGAPDGACFAGGVATSSQNGLMSAADKAKLDGINLSNYALASHTHDDRYYTESEVDSKFGNIQAKSLASTGYGNSSLTYYQTHEEFDGNSNWTHYIIANHGDGSSYYHYTIGLPFWDVPIYKRQTGNTSNVSGWHTFITSENVGSQSVNYSNSSNYSNSAGNADTVDGYHASDIGKFYGINTSRVLASQYFSSGCCWDPYSQIDWVAPENSILVCNGVNNVTIDGNGTVPGGYSFASSMFPVKAGSSINVKASRDNYPEGWCTLFGVK